MEPQGTSAHSAVRAAVPDGHVILESFAVHNVALYFKKRANMLVVGFFPILWKQIACKML